MIEKQVFNSQPEQHETTESAGVRLEAGREALGENLNDDEAGKRFASIRKATVSARRVFSTLGDRMAIEHEGYRLSTTENIIARFVRPLGGLDRDFASTPIVQKFKDNAYDRSMKRLNPNEEMTNKEMVIAGAYELMTLATIRTMGLAGLNAMASIAERKTGSATRANKVAKTLGKVTGRSLAIHEKGLHNPGIRSAKGYTQRVVRREFGSIRQVANQKERSA